MVKTAYSLTLVGLLFLTGCNAVPQRQLGLPAEPEGSSGYVIKRGWTAKKFMIAAANPIAAEAGYRILKANGSAVDAAIATQMVLTLVEPQSSGIGGGAFMLHYDGERVQALDGRETAPAGVSPDLFIDKNGRPESFYTAAVGGRSVGVPGVLRLLEDAHRQHGKLPWAELFEPAIGLAENGFAVSNRLATLLESEQHLQKDPVAAAYFYDAAGNPRPAGHRLKNPALAATLRQIAKGGDAFYRGSTAQDIVDKVTLHPTNPGRMTMGDMARYRVVERDPVCTDYRSWLVCGMPPPSSGSVAIAQILGMLEIRDMTALAAVEGTLNADAVHLLAEAGRLAYADRSRYIADPDYVALPGDSVLPLLDKTYLAQRAALITERSMGRAGPGLPFAHPLAWGTDTSPERTSTSHISIVDADGNAVAMTTSIENVFGSRQMVGGFLLNNELTDFSFVPNDANGPIANRVEPGKRPRSTMAPTLVFDKKTKKLLLVVGSAGGSSIINYVTKVLIGTLDWGLNVQDAINLPNTGSRNGPTEVEKDRLAPALITALQAKGHTIVIQEKTSGIQGLMRWKVDGQEVWFGGADPRREGVAMGD